tara:strand:- start:865 stop:1032 length:168 start_codon:yes stop_codon:yes gene_type:complete
MHLNGILFLPILSCKKNIGPLELILISKEIIINKGRKETKKNKENKKSKTVLINL